MKSSIPCFILLASLGLWACGKVIPVRYYDLRYPTAAAVAGTAKYPKSLAIAGFTAPSVYRQSRILYRIGAQSAQVGFYEDHRWVSPPPELMTQAALLHFRNSRLFARVVPYTDSSQTDYVLRGQIQELEEVDLTDGYYGRITVQAELAQTGESAKVLWSGPVSVSRKTTVRDVDAIMDELARGVNEALQSIAQSVDQAVAAAQRPEKTP